MNCVLGIVMSQLKHYIYTLASLENPVTHALLFLLTLATDMNSLQTQLI